MLTFSLENAKCPLKYKGDVLPKFIKMRVSLDGASASSLEGLEDTTSYLTRHGFLLQSFGENRDFLPNKSAEKASFISTEAPEGYVAGFFARERDISARPKVANSFPVVNHENWELSLFLMDITDDSQIVWMQENKSVGSPKAILEAFFDNLPKNGPLGQYRATIGYMDSERTYWDVIEKYEDKITKLTFKFIKPNMLKGKKRIDDFNKAVFEGGADTTEHIHSTKNPGQLKPKSDILKSSAEIAQEGAGEAEVFVGAKKVWSSSKDYTTEVVSEEIMPTVEDSGFVRVVIDKLFGGLFKSNDD